VQLNEKSAKLELLSTAGVVPSTVSGGVGLDEEPVELDAGAEVADDAPDVAADEAPTDDAVLVPEAPADEDATALDEGEGWEVAGTLVAPEAEEDPVDADVAPLLEAGPLADEEEPAAEVTALVAPDELVPPEEAGGPLEEATTTEPSAAEPASSPDCTSDVNGNNNWQDAVNREHPASKSRREQWRMRTPVKQQVAALSRYSPGRVVATARRVISRRRRCACQTREQARPVAGWNRAAGRATAGP
jgi:hypothetical protein